jgi:hypothetical protein
MRFDYRQRFPVAMCKIAASRNIRARPVLKGYETALRIHALELRSLRKVMVDRFLKAHSRISSKEALARLSKT